MKYFLTIFILLLSTHYSIAVAQDSAPLTPEEKKQIAELKPEFKRPSPQKHDKNQYELGKALFFDTTFSNPTGMSCGTCHDPKKGWSDGLPTAKGKNGKILPRKTQTLWNIGDDTVFFWDGRADSLEKQVLMALYNKDEMAATNWQDLSVKLQKYASSFQTAFPNDPNPVSEKNFSVAVATFVKAQISPKTAFDAWIDGKNNALTPDQQKGFLLFNGKANCTACHLGWKMSDGWFNDIGLPDHDLGKGAVSKNPDEAHFFKTPSLRDIKNRAPYTHNGMLKNLEDVIDHYNKGSFDRGDTDIPDPDKQADDTAFHNFTQPLNLTKTERKQLILFLNSL